MAVLIAEGFSDRQIARILTLSVRTVEQYVGNLLRKCDVSGRAGIVGRCYVMGIIEHEQWSPAWSGKLCLYSGCLVPYGRALGRKRDVGEHTERSFILDLALALAEDRRRDIVRKTKNGLEAARTQGKVGGRRPVVDKRAAILDRSRPGESIRTIAAGVKVSVGVVHNTLKTAEGNGPQRRE